MALVQVDFLSESLMRTVTISAIIPFDKDTREDKQPFKTLYLLHGMMGNHRDWVNGTRIQRWAEEKNLAIIMPSGENYFYVDSKASGERFGEFIGKELPKKMARLFHLSSKREDNFIGGLSMGGYGALVNGLKYNETFSKIGALSSGLLVDKIVDDTTDYWVTDIFGPSYLSTVFGDLNELKGSDKDYEALILKLKEEEANIPDIYLCCGTEDTWLEANKQYANFLKEQGISHTYEEGPGGHDWDFWDTYIKRIIDWLPLDE